MSVGIERQNTITRKNLVSSLMIGLIVGILAGVPLGWIAHQFYAERRLADVLVCREKNETCRKSKFSLFAGQDSKINRNQSFPDPATVKGVEPRSE